MPNQIPRFWRELGQRYSLNAVRCANCGGVWFPVRSICPTCRHESVGKLEPTDLSGRGEVVTWTVERQPPRGFEVQAPYVMAIVELEEGPRVTAQVVDCKPEEIAKGTPVKAVFRRIGEEGASGMIHYGYKFVLAG